MSILSASAAAFNLSRLVVLLMFEAATLLHEIISVTILKVKHLVKILKLVRRLPVAHLVDDAS
jgi:hypothetical protein